MGAVFAAAAAASAAPLADGNDPAAAVAALTGARTRLAWVSCAGSDANASALMCLDSNDGRGPRVLVERRGELGHVHFVPDGNQVVFGDLTAGKIRSVSWGGGASRELADGVPTHVWRDPCSGVQWVCAMPKWKLRDADMVFRFRLDRPDVIESVWEKTPISWGWFSLSADGRRAVGAFPWPYCALVSLPEQESENRSGGCWPSIAPDNSYRFFVLGGSHSSMNLYDMGGWPRQVVLRADGGPVGQVSMPQWTNHARFMTLASPVVGDRRASEIYLGRFDAEFSGVQRWVRVTTNDVPDLYGDAWIEPGKGPKEGVVMVRTPEIIAGATTRPGRRQGWPDIAGDSVFVWEDGGKPNRVVDGSRPGHACVAEARGLAVYGRRWEMDLSAGGCFVAEAPPAMLKRLRASGQMTVEALLTPPTDDAGTAAAATAPAARDASLGRVLSYGAAGEPANFALLQRGDELLLELRTSAGAYVVALGRLHVATPAHVCLTYRGGELRWWLDGEARSPVVQPKGDFTKWNDGPLVFGARWAGALEAVAVTPRAMGGEEIDIRLAMLAGRIVGRRAPRRVVVEARLAEVTLAPAPDAILPYRRALVGHLYEVRKVLAGRCDAGRIVAAHWAILDGRTLRAEWVRGGVYRLELEPFADNPQLETERFVTGVDAAKSIPLYFCPARPPGRPLRIEIGTSRPAKARPGSS